MEEKKYINPNILDEGNQMELLQDSEDEMDKIVRCNNCGQPTRYGNTLMICGFVGCENIIKIGDKYKNCYFEDLMPRVQKYKNSENSQEHSLYVNGTVYRWRDACES